MAVFVSPQRICCGIELEPFVDQAQVVIPPTQAEFSSTVKLRADLPPSTSVDRLSGWQLNLESIGGSNGTIRIGPVQAARDNYIFQRSSLFGVVRKSDSNAIVFDAQFPFDDGIEVSADQNGVGLLDATFEISARAFGPFEIRMLPFADSVWTDAAQPTQNDRYFRNGDTVQTLLDVYVTTPGDSNLDRVFDPSDLIKIFQAGEFEDSLSKNSTWETGDWNGDHEFNTSDLIIAFQMGTYNEPPVQGAVVPESVPVAPLFLMACYFRKNRRSPRKGHVVNCGSRREDIDRSQ